MLAPFGVAFGLLLLWIVSLWFTQVQLVDAAREAARLVARGEPVAAAAGVARGRHLPTPRSGSPSTTARDRAGLGPVAAAAARAAPRRCANAGGVGGVGRRAARELLGQAARARFGHGPRAVGRDGAVRRRGRHGTGRHGRPAQAPGRVGGRPRRPGGQPSQPGRPRRVRRRESGGASQRRTAGAAAAWTSTSPPSPLVGAPRRGGATGGRSRSTPGPRPTSMSAIVRRLRGFGDWRLRRGVTSALLPHSLRRGGTPSFARRAYGRS